MGSLGGTIVAADQRHLGGHPGQASTFVVTNDGRNYMYFIFTTVVEAGVIDYLAGGEESVLTDDSVACIDRVADSLRLIAAKDSDGDG
ncbi:MAG: hypothetical protein HGB17_13360, partial [Syntrophobacteraceae bacterium]|nr:hypothetical protein [Syntrophobacteraceae bacterium]